MKTRDPRAKKRDAEKGVEPAGGGGDSPRAGNVEECGRCAFRVLLESVNEGALIVGRDDLVAYCNEGFCRMQKTPAGKLVGSRFALHFRLDAQPQIAALIARAKESGASEGEVMLRIGGGLELPVQLALKPVEMGGKREICAVITDLSSERMSRRALHLLSLKVLSAQEEERKRIASELHDTIPQTLAGLKFALERLICISDTLPPEEIEGQLKKLIPILQYLIDETTTIYRGLKPTMLGGKGVLLTLSWFCRQFQKLYPRHSVKLAMNIEEQEIPDALKIVIFRIAQEALNNVAKHSRADSVQLVLEKTGEGIELVIADDGAGIDLSAMASQAGFESIGLTGMREKAELTGGTFSFDSSPGKGATVRVFWSASSQSELRKPAQRRGKKKKARQSSG